MSQVESTNITDFFMEFMAIDEWNRVHEGDESGIRHDPGEGGTGCTIQDTGLYHPNRKSTSHKCREVSEKYAHKSGKLKNHTHESETCKTLLKSTGRARKMFPLLKVHNSKSISQIWVNYNSKKKQKDEVFLWFFLVESQKRFLLKILNSKVWKGKIFHSFLYSIYFAW